MFKCFIDNESEENRKERHKILKFFGYSLESVALDNLKNNRGAFLALSLNEKGDKKITCNPYLIVHSESRMIFDIYLKNKYDLLRVDDSGNTILHFASRYGYENSVLQCIEYEKTLINKKNFSKMTPLLLACVRGHIGIIEIFLKHGANINDKDEKGYAPLHCIVSLNYNPRINLIGIVELLYNYGADINATSKDGKTPLDIILERDCVYMKDVEIWLIEQGAKKDNCCIS